MTCPFFNNEAVASERGVTSCLPTLHFFVAVSRISVLDTNWLPVDPPTKSALPSGNRTAECSISAVLSDGPEDHRRVRGSNTSTLGVAAATCVVAGTVIPPTTRTRPSIRVVAEWSTLPVTIDGPINQRSPNGLKRRVDCRNPSDWPLTPPTISTVPSGRSDAV